MVDFSSIQNEQLRTLAMSSPAIATLADAEKWEMIQRLASLPSDRQNLVVQLFVQEQEDRKVLDEQQAKELAQASLDVDKAVSDIKNAEKDYDAAIRKLLEAQSSQEDAQRSELLLQQLQTL
mgnify:FL=1